MIDFQPDGSWQVRPLLSVMAAMLVLSVGKWPNQRSTPLREYNIPEPVAGGVLFSLAFSLCVPGQE